MRELTPAALSTAELSCWDSPKLLGFLASRHFSHWLMEAALCCTKLTCETCVEYGALKQNQASSQQL